MTGPRTTRRTFLLGSIAAAVPVVGISLRPWRPLFAVAQPDLAGRLAGLLADPHGARSLGREYLAARPAEANVSRLVQEIVHALPAGSGSLAAMQDDDLRRLLADGARRDFEALRVVNLDGWYLATTEARLCALATYV